VAKQISQDELKREILDIVRKLNIEDAALCAPVHSYEETLELRGITQLRRLGKVLRVKYYGKRDRQELIPAIIDAMNQPGMLRVFLKALDRVAWQFFLKAVSQKEIQSDHLSPDCYMPAQQIGLLQCFYHDCQLYFVVPDEIKSTFKGLASSGFIDEKDHQDNLLEFALAAVNLYGVISQDDFVALFNNQYKHKTSIDEMFGILIDYVYADIGFCFYDQYIVADEFEEDDFKGVESLLAERNGKPRYAPPYEEFIRYADYDYYEYTPELEKLRSYLITLVSDPFAVPDLLDQIHDHCVEEARPQVFFDLLASAGVVFSGIEQVNEVLRLILDVQNNTRRWNNFGHSPNELHVLSKSKILPFPVNQSSDTVKVGRNDPCPCGSGRKYKNCCGR
jgi:uncharacterized protein YecA (UPF0149 family)